MFRWRLYIGLIVIMAMKSAGFVDYTIPVVVGECLDYVIEHVKIEDLAVNVAIYLFLPFARLSPLLEKGQG